MPTVKISELPVIDHYSTNTEATLVVGVDLSTGTTGKSTLTTLGEGLYAYQPLKVGENQVLFTNTIGQFSGNSNTFLQINHQNFNANGSTDYVASTSDSDNSTKYIDFGIDGPTYNDPINYPFFKPYDGYLYVYGPSNTSSSGNLILGTASSNSTITFITGLSSYKNVVAKMTSTGLVLNTQSYITFGDGSIQSVAASPANYSQAAFTLANNNSVLAQASFNTANTAASNTVILQGTNVTQNTRLTVIEGTDVSQNARMTIIEGVDATQNSRITIIEGTNTTQNTNISATDGKMQSAYSAANSALPNTTTTFGGTLNISNNLTVNGTVVLANTNFAATEAAFRITAAGSSQNPTQAGTLIQLTGKANTAARMLIDSFGTSNAAYSIIAGRTARGTVGSPTATQNNDILLRIAGNSYGTTGYAPFGDARIDFVATENRSDTNRGSRIRFWNTPNGSNVVNEIASFNADSVTFSGVVNPTKGFIFTPRLPVGNQTTIAIDFTNDVIIKANLAADLTVTLSNFVFGKVVEVWLTNTSGLTRTVTHGCSSINSSVNATTFTMSSTSSAYLRYFSINGDLANTFVAIQSA